MDTMKAKEDLSHAISARKVMSVQRIRKLSHKRGARKDTMLLFLASLPASSAQLAQNAPIRLLSLPLVKWESMLRRQVRVTLPSGLACGAQLAMNVQTS